MPFSQRPPLYPRHEGFVAPARLRGEWWRIILGCATVLLVHEMLRNGAITALNRRYGSVFSEALMLAISLGRTPGSLVMLLFFTGILGVSALIAVRIVHDRAPRTLLGPSVRSATTIFLYLAPFLIALNILLLPLMIAAPEITSHTGLSTLIKWLPLALPALLVQVLSEELIFRGYLQQQLAAVSANPAVWMLLPTLLFALGHYDTAAYGPNAWLVCVWAAIFGALAADLTARTGNLGAAIAFHFASNVAALFFVGYGSTLDGLALWTNSADVTDPAAFRLMLFTDLITMLNAWLLTRLVLRV